MQVRIAIIVFGQNETKHSFTLHRQPLLTVSINECKVQVKYKQLIFLFFFRLSHKCSLHSKQTKRRCGRLAHPQYSYAAECQPRQQNLSRPVGPHTRLVSSFADQSLPPRSFHLNCIGISRKLPPSVVRIYGTQAGTSRPSPT